MSNQCLCGEVLQNLGISTCEDLAQIARRPIFVPELNSSGVKNEFANVAAVTKSALQAKFDAANPLDRFFPGPIQENVTDLRAEAIFQEFTSGVKQKVRDGVRTMVMYVTAPNGASPIWLAKIKAWGCAQAGLYIVDASGNFIYNTDNATKLKVQPILIEKGTFDAQLVKATDAEVQMIMITFDVSKSMSDENLRYIDANNLDFEGLTSDLYSLLDVVGVADTITTTSFQVPFTTDQYGLPVGGLVAGDNTLYNNTTASAVVITSVTETGVNTGIYDYVIPLQTSADELVLTTTKARYDFSVPNAQIITIP